MPRFADEHLVTEALDEFDEPSAVTAGLDADDHFTREGGIEAANILPFMRELDEPLLKKGAKMTTIAQIADIFLFGKERTPENIVDIALMTVI